MKKSEIMAPAGSFAAMAAAINAGCDSIYFGVEQLNMRARASDNFKVSDLAKVAKVAKEAGIKTYIALNTILYEHDLTLMKKIIDAAKAAGITAVIAADIAALQYAREVGQQVHASTQLSISNFDALKFYAQFCDVMVLAREVDLNMMKQICDQVKEQDIRGPNGELVKVEVFVHGALCIAQSGRCHMSILQTNTSAQRGACLQECRKKYRVIEEETGREMRIENEYILSPKDLCCIDFLDKLVDTGVTVFKIEGRGRSPQYVDAVVRCYREAVDAIAEGTYTKAKIKNWIERLKEVYNRGFCDGYYLGKPLPDWSGFSGNHATTERVFIGLVSHYFDKAKVAEIKLQAQPLKIGDTLIIMGKTTGVVKADVTAIYNDDQPVENAKHPAVITVPIAEKVRRNDSVYLLRERQLDEKN
ncbi:collagenase-like protease [Candidatus Peregrinibacteria bacterium CG11_big_fil_rev_8_21_14_0_20_41_10]|nr:MAG: collagenase-like protease [Candidatus Peregrinibacteria bacterium CG11_big_fil_rev_8_21_14_0_20_41_10]PIZ77035.1 MAG: collagenase-like protease [Candidatus Peregrinibacteria bacterium CG_4_10_14_0_2_um_filter_41_8]PJC37795.1 MAG: collagenase-like protease [Candidatus Peregrinibacteria bacterium CG_4_9_14_0_2_um_filter_41_14]